MSHAERQSPRTAIRKWLQDSNGKSTTKTSNASPEQQEKERGSKRHSRRHHETRFPSQSKDQNDERVHQRHNKSGTRPSRITNEDRLVGSQQAQPQMHSKENKIVVSSSLGLAERLGLHAPFRTFKDHRDNDINDVQSRPRKRKRSRSSTSSYLEPAAANDFSDNDHDRPSHTTVLRTASTGPALCDKRRNTSPTASQSSETISPSPEKLLKSYERRPRHKTRQDRYELKDGSRDSEKTKRTAKKDRGEKKQKKHKRKEKSGAALMHDFTAQNVARDRLTLKPAKTLGLFGKGRASSPVRRRGLPDLAFSEMTFLTSRRDKPKDSLEDTSNRFSGKKKQRKSTKAADTEAEISRYFKSAKPTNLDVKSPRGQRYQQNRRRSQDYGSPQASIDLPDRPFLGFGSCGPNTSISPAKIPVNTDSKALRLGDSRSPTRSSSYLTWSQSGGLTYASPPPDKPHLVAPLTSSKLSNRKRTSPIPHKGQHLVPPVSPPGVQTTFSGAQGAASRSSLRHENANEPPDQNREPRSATDERLKSKEKSRNHRDTRTIEFDAAKISQDIEDSVRDNTHPTETLQHNGPESELTPRNQGACQSSGHEPGLESQPHDVRPLSAPMPIISPQKDPLDDILEALLRDCSGKVAGSNPVSHAPSTHRNSLDSEKARIPDMIKQDSHMHPQTYVNSIHAPEVPASASDSTRKSRGGGFQHVPAHDGSMSTRTLSRGSQNSSGRPDLGYTLGYQHIPPTRSQIESRIAWNGYDNLYERQHEKADLTPDTLKEYILPYAARKDNVSGLSRETGHAARCDEYAHDLHPEEVGDGLNDYRRLLYKRNENNQCQEFGHREWKDQYNDVGAFFEPGESNFDGNFDNGSMAERQINDYHGKQMHIDDEESIPRGTGQHVCEQRLFTTNLPDTYSSWRPHCLLSRSHDLERRAADAQIDDVDPALSGFWTPHKLY